MTKDYPQRHGATKLTTRFVHGEEVRLKSGGPVMVVDVTVCPPPYLYCTWAAPAQKSHKGGGDAFFAEMLDSAEEEERRFQMGRTLAGEIECGAVFWTIEKDINAAVTVREYGQGSLWLCDWFVNDRHYQDALLKDGLYIVDQIWPRADSKQ